MSMISAQTSQNPCPFVDFASEMTMYIFGFLRPETITSCCARVCSLWNTIAKEESLWKGFCERANLTQYKTTFFSWEKTYLVNSGKGRLESLVAKEPETWQGHDEEIACFFLDKAILISGGHDRKIKFWDLSKKEQCVKTLEIHSSVCSLQFDGTTLFAGTGSGTIEFWDLTANSRTKILDCPHAIPVRCLELQETTLISACLNTIQVWDISSGECVQRFIGSKALVTSILVRDKTLVSGSNDSTIRVWDISSGECKKTLRGDQGGVFSVQWQGTTLISACSRDIQIWDFDTEICLKTLKGHSKTVLSIQLQGKFLVSRSIDTTMKIWDISTGDCFKTFNEERSDGDAVFLFQGMTLVCGTWDGKIKIWKEDLFS